MYSTYETGLEFQHEEAIFPLVLACCMITLDHNRAMSFSCREGKMQMVIEGEGEMEIKGGCR